MPFTEFCCRSGGSNLNAGTRTGSSTEPGTAADLTYASGSWVAATGVFTVASGNPQSDGVAVGDFASVYANGSTVTGFVGRVTARDTTTITVSLTAKAGTAPTDGTGNRTLKIGGAWAGPSGASGFPLTFLASACTNSSGHPPRINLKNDQTYSVTSGIAPTTSQNSLTFQGYTSSYGDYGRAVIDGGTTGASYVVFAPVTNSLICYDLIFSNNGSTGTAAGVNSSANCSYVRCVFRNFRGIGLFAAAMAIECEAHNCGQGSSANGAFYAVGACSRCVSHDNGNAGFHTCTTLLDCISDTNATDGFNMCVYIDNCDSYNNTSDGIKVPSGNQALIQNCNLIKNGAYGININAGAVHIANCGFGAGTQANVSGKINAAAARQYQEIGSVDYASDVTPWVDPANGDFRISLASAKGAGRGTFTQTSSSYSGTAGYPDIGAAQAAASGGGSRLVNIRGGADQ